MSDWDTFDTVFSEKEAEILKDRMERAGFEVWVKPRNTTSGEMPCWDIFIRNRTPMERVV